MKTAGRKWFLTAVLIGATYFVVAIAFGQFANWATFDWTRVTWNRLAFLASAVAFAFHIGYEHFRLGRSSLRNAAHVAIAVGLGAFLIALAGNIHEFGSASGYRLRMLIAFVAWPLITAVPAFLLHYLRPRGST